MMDFERWFKEGTSRFERFLIFSATVFLVLLIVSQALLTQPGVRKMLSLVDSLEGEPYQPVEVEQPTAARPQISGEVQYLELSVGDDTDASGILVSVNGKAVAAFGSQKTVKVPVQNGDHVGIDGDMPQDVVEITVTAVSEQMLSPQQGQTIIYSGTPETVSWVDVEIN
ncbi:MAG: hypothetical protein SCK29_08395 [Bacillota bacterium]|nr:hypothetical protein [Bacillota bacterium]MDW7684117.1 hypothetical protein [Bacillota bacterium]